MTAGGWLQIALYCAALTALTPLIGAYMFRVFRGERVLLTPVLGPLERLTYRAIRTNPERGQDWRAYAKSALVFSALFWLALYLILRTQGIHPFNPEGYDSGTWDVTFNTTSSFISNTNWQFYAGEGTLSYFSQMTGLAVQNFVSAAVGIAVCIAVIRGFASRSASQLGNFWQDTVRALLYVLLPISFVVALVYVSQGAIQTLGDYVTYDTVTGGEQTLALGPVASQEAIKLLGTNGGGFFNVNSSMPFENPSGLSNFVQMLTILLIPAGLTSTFGRMVGNRRQGWAIYGAMFTMFIVAVAVVYIAETHGSPAQDAAGPAEAATSRARRSASGRRTRALFTVITTVASCGAVTSAFDSMTGIGGAVPLFNMGTGEVVFGGVGSGLYGMLLFVLLAVFIAGLMVGRTPEYLGKKIEAREVKLVMIGTLAVPLTGPVRHRAGGRHQVRRPLDLQPRARRASPRPSTRTPRRPTTTAPPSPASRATCSPTRPATSAPSASPSRTFWRRGDAVRTFRADGGGARCGGRPRRQEGRPGQRGDVPDRFAHLRVLLISVIVIVAALTLFPAFLLGPIVQGLTDQLF